MSSTVRERVRHVLKEHAQLATDERLLRDDSDLYAAGMNSRASVSVMLALENEFGIEFPDSLLSRGAFESVAAICDAVTGLLAPA